MVFIWSNRYSRNSARNSTRLDFEEIERVIYTRFGLSSESVGRRLLNSYRTHSFIPIAQQMVNGRANCRFRGNLRRTVQFDRQIQDLALPPHFRFIRPLQRLAMFQLTFIKEMQHAEFPSCLRFSFTRNKLEKSRKTSSPACCILCHDWNRNRGNLCQS